MAAALEEGDSHQLHGLIHQLERELYAHLDQEEQTLFPLAIPPADQAAIASKMGAHVPDDFFQEATAWMLRYQSQEEREGFLRMFQEGAPPEAFGAIKAIAKQLLSESEWLQLTQRLPALAT